MRTMQAALIALAILTAAFLPMSCPSAEIDFAPLLHYRTTPEGYDLMVAGPLFEKTTGFTAVRPLYYHDSSQTDFLYPLGHSTDTHSYFVPFMRSSEDKDEDSLDALIFSKGRYEDESYGGLFPFYGTYSHRFGHDSLTYVLWPVYTRAMDDGAVTTTVLWPFLKYSEGREFQLWPLYGHVRKANSDDRYALWPFLFRKRGIEDYDAFLPFFSYSRGATYKGVSVIWPFFTYNRNTDPQLTSLTFPWPLARYATGEYEERELFPFYWSKDYGDSYRMKMVLWPLYKHSVSYDPKEDIREDDLSLLILSGTTVKTSGNTVISKEVSAWPLWHRHDRTDGSFWCVPWLIPLHDEGFGRNILPLLTLAQGRSTGGREETSILWHTFYYTKDNERSRFSLSFLFSYEHGQDYRQLGFISDLLHVRWSARPGT